MKRINIGDFREHMDDYVACDQVLEIERDGRRVGVFIPVAASPSDVVAPREPKPDVKEAMDRLGQAVQRVLDETGLTEDELVDLFDLNKPFPEGPIGRPKTAA